MLLDVHLLARASELAIAVLMLLTLVILKAAIAALVTRPFTTSRFKALRTASSCRSAVSSGSRCAPSCCRPNGCLKASASRCCVAIVLSMLLSPLILNNNKRVARWLLHEHAPAPPPRARRGGHHRDRAA